MSFVAKHALELAVSLIVFALIIFMNASRTAVYDKICYGLAEDMKLDVKCHNLTGAPEKFNDEVRKENARYNTWDTIGQTVTPSIAGLILSARGDRVGRKINFVLGLSSSLAIYSLHAFVLSTNMSVYFMCFEEVLSGAVFLGCGGTFTLFVNTALQHVSDVTTSASERTQATARLMSVLMVSFTAGGMTSAYLLKIWTYVNQIYLAVVLSALALVLVVLYVENIPPKVKDDKPSSVKHLVGDIWHMLSKVRPKGMRFYLHLALLSFFLGGPQLETTGPVLTLYVFEPPLSLSPQALGMYFALGGITGTIGSIFGAKVLAERGWHETDLILLSIVSKILEYLGICYVSSAFGLFCTLPLGTFAMLMRSAYQTLFSELVDANEVGKVTALQGLVLDSARLVLGVTLNGIYVATAKYLRSSVFFFMIILCGIAFSFVYKIKHVIAGEDQKKTN